MVQAACKAMALGSSSSSCSINPLAASQRTAIVGYGVALQGLAMPRNSLKNAGMSVAIRSSLLLSSLRGMPLRSGDKNKGSWLTERQSRTAVVRASSIGVVKDVKLVSKEPIYYNVTLTVSKTSEVVKWYTTPGQYVDLIRVDSAHDTASAFFIASPVGKPCEELEFLIQDVPNTVANEIINSKPGDRVSISTNTWSTGFNLNELNPIEEFQSILMFASGYGMGPFRALIETEFEANKRKDAILYAMYTPNQAPYMDRYSAWEKTGVKIELAVGPLNNIIQTNAANTVVLMVASEDEQEELATYFEGKGVPADKILTLFSGIPTFEKSYYSKVLHNLRHYPKFPHHGEKHVPVELKI